MRKITKMNVFIKLIHIFSGDFSFSLMRSINRQITLYYILYMAFEYEYECLCMYECMCVCVWGGGGVSNCKYLHGMARRLQNLIGQSVVMTNWANISPLAICARPSPFVVGHLRINNIDCIFLYAMQFAAEQTECATSNKQISQTNVNGGQQCGMRHAARALANASWWEATLIKYSTAFWGKLLATAVACGSSSFPILLFASRASAVESSFRAANSWMSFEIRLWLFAKPESLRIPKRILFDTKLIWIVWEMCRYIYSRYFKLKQTALFLLTLYSLQIAQSQFRIFFILLP